ncbi:MAG: peptidyl-Asp metallopeptidase [Polaromonas sp.]|nr:peptidyl-Asp metallopeptidase [Polaromonas sp.]
MALKNLLLDEEVSQDIADELESDEFVPRQRLVYLNPALLFEANRHSVKGRIEPIRFLANFFDDVKLECSVEIKRRDKETISFVGKVNSNKDSRVVMTLTQRDGASVTTLMVFTGVSEFTLFPYNEYLSVVKELNLAAPMDCQEDFEANEDSLIENFADKDSDIPIGGNYTVNLLAVYNSNVLNQSNVLEVDGTINGLVANLNAALEASLEGTGVKVAVNLVAAIHHDFDGMSDAYATALDQLRNSNWTQEIRLKNSADLVTLFRKLPGRSIANCLRKPTGNPNSAFSVVSWEQAKNRHSLSHEIGHNFGCPHNIENADCLGLNVDNKGVHWGYQWKHSKEGIVRGTLMSYQGIRILNFSNPLVEYNEDPTGTPVINNAAAIAKSASAIADYKNRIRGLIDS